MNRIENDPFGSMEIPSGSLYGIHSARAGNNFPDHTPFPIEWYKSVGLVKKACYLAFDRYKNAIQSKSAGHLVKAGQMDRKILDALIEAASEIAEGRHFEHFIVPGISGGAGTSINMNINEIIANLALIRVGKKPGEYTLIDPVEHANIFQSTNDVIPTSLKIAIMKLLREMEVSVNNLRSKTEALEQEHRMALRIGYTQMQEAVPTSVGKMFSTYSEAFSRDWWRISKCFERLKLVNLGGGAIGTGLSIPRFFIMEVIGQLQNLCELPVARSENMPDTTSNLDSFVEVNAILKSHAVNLEKMVSDIRLLASDLHGTGTVRIPPKQVGSSIMPGKINPVIPEFVISATHRIYANDTVVTSLSAQGCLELNAYLPVIGLSMIESLKLLIAADRTISENLLEGLIVQSDAAIHSLMHSPGVTTALIPYLGYHQAEIIAVEMKNTGDDIMKCNDRLNLISAEKLREILKPENLLKLGYTLEDLKDE